MIDGKYDEKAAQAAESLDIVLAMMMKANNQAFKIEKHVHNYPHCWRTDKPVLIIRWIAGSFVQQLVKTG